MRDGARVTSIDALQRFRTVLSEYAEEMRLALSNAEADVRRTHWWLQHEQQSHWRRQIRLRERRLAEAKAELLRAELAAKDNRGSTVLERRAHDKAARSLEEARVRAERTKAWIRKLDRALELYKGQVQPLGARFDRDLPTGLARLTTMMDRLDAYVKTAPPPGADAPATTPARNESADDEPDTENEG